MRSPAQHVTGGSLRARVAHGRHEQEGSAMGGSRGGGVGAHSTQV